MRFYIPTKMYVLYVMVHKNGQMNLFSGFKISKGTWISLTAFFSARPFPYQDEYVLQPGRVTMEGTWPFKFPEIYKSTTCLYKFYQ